MNADIDINELLCCAVEVAKASGNHALANEARRNEVITTATHDVKLQLDIECQEKAHDIINANFPDHDFLGEEDSEEEIRGQKSEVREIKDQPSEYQWIVDPIDGTVNFSHGMPWWCCSVAVRKENTILAGAIYAPALNDTYTATINAPSLLNNEPIKVSDVKQTKSSMVLTGLDRFVTKNKVRFSIMTCIAENTQKTRIMGSAALDLCQVACGRAEGYFESGIYIWDIAAGGLIVQQAGGKSEIMAYHDTEHRLIFLASNGHIHQELKELVLQE